MRKLIIFVALFMLLSVPAFAADAAEDIGVTVTIQSIGDFNINVGGMAGCAIVIDSWDDYAKTYLLGKIVYGGTTNSPWFLKMHYTTGTWLGTWTIQESHNGVLAYADMNTWATTYDNGDNEVFSGYDWFFKFAGLADGDGPGNYDATIHVTLGN